MISSFDLYLMDRLQNGEDKYKSTHGGIQICLNGLKGKETIRYLQMGWIAKKDQVNKLNSLYLRKLMTMSFDIFFDLVIEGFLSDWIF